MKPKILFVSSKNPSYLEDVIYHGLISIFGRKQVIDFPRKPSYHCDKASKKEIVNGKCCCCWADPRLRKVPILHFYDRSVSPQDEVEVENFDLVVFGDLYPEIREIISKVLSKAKKSSIPIAFLDGSDLPFVRYIYYKGVTYFKRETLPKGLRSLLNLNLTIPQIMAVFIQFFKAPNKLAVPIGISNSFDVVPLPFGIIDYGFKPVREKVFDIAFVATLRTPWRRKVYNFLKKYSKKRRLKAFLGGGLNWIDYMNVLSKSRISISCRGAGFDTYRYWEIPYSGSLLFSERLPIIIPKNFTDGANAVFFSDLKELKNKLDFYLDKDLTEITESGRNHLLRHHTSINRARRLINVMESKK